MNSLNTALIGYTGFVGQNLKAQYQFNHLYNSQNYRDIEDKSFDLVVCSGIQASMWLANNSPADDWQNIQALLDTLRTIKANKFVLISSIAIYHHPVKDVYEDTHSPEINTPYGFHRYRAEEEIKELFENHLIVRLPALFGPGLKKNFIYDLLNRAPSFMPSSKFHELTNQLTNSIDRDILSSSYQKQDNDRFSLKETPHSKLYCDLLSVLEKLNFTSLNFTDSRSQYQFYDLKNLWSDIEQALENNLSALNLSSTPLTAQEIAKEICEIDFKHQISDKEPFFYDMKSRHAKLWHKEKDYLYSKEETLNNLQNFFKQEKIS